MGRDNGFVIISCCDRVAANLEVPDRLPVHVVRSSQGSGKILDSVSFLIYTNVLLKCMYIHV